MTREIKLTQGLVALVDDEDFELLSRFKWHVKDGYAVRNALNGLKRSTLRMHREILQAAKNIEIDHINGNKSDNRRSNLRLATSNQNRRNRGAQKNNTSGFKGVCWDKQKQKWKAQIQAGDKKKRLGFFNDPVEAAKVYDKAARELHGEFAKTNF